MGAYFYNITGDKETVFVDKKEDLPVAGVANILYVVRKDENNMNKGSIYIWSINEYRSITNGISVAGSLDFTTEEW